MDVDRLEAIKKPKNALLNWSGTMIVFSALLLSLDIVLINSFQFTENNLKEYKERNNIHQIMPDVPSSEGEDSAEDQYNMLFDD